MFNNLELTLTFYLTLCDTYLSLKKISRNFSTYLIIQYNLQLHLLTFNENFPMKKIKKQLIIEVL